MSEFTAADITWQAPADYFTVMLSPMFAGPTRANSGPRPILHIVFLTGVVFSVFLLFPLFLFVKPYHAIRERAASFNASPSCYDTVALAGAASTPCTIEWANVLKRYYGSNSSQRASQHTYHYYLRVRGGYGDEHTVEVKNENVFWRTQNGAALKLQRWGDSTTAVELISGESSPTAENPNWQLQNELRGLRAIVVFEIVLVAITVMSAIGLRQLAA